VRQFAWTYRVAREARQWVLQSLSDSAWEDLYAFTLEPQHHVDYEMANHYTSTHPSSRFTQVLTAQTIAPDVRRVLRNREYTEDRGTDLTRRVLANDGEVLHVLAQTFGLRLPPGTRFRYRDDTG